MEVSDDESHRFQGRGPAPSSWPAPDPGLGTFELDAITNTLECMQAPAPSGPRVATPAQPKPRQYRQEGDVFLLECDPAETSGAQWERPHDGRLVLALGEATGHAHAIRAGSRAGLRGRDGKRWLEAMEPVKLEHEEHGPITIEPGTYRDPHPARVRRPSRNAPLALRRRDDAPGARLMAITLADASAISQSPAMRAEDYAAAWRRVQRSTERADRPRAEAAVRALYADAGLAKPRIVWVDSPLAGLQAYHVARRPAGSRWLGNTPRATKAAAGTRNGMRSRSRSTSTPAGCARCATRSSGSSRAASPNAR